MPPLPSAGASSAAPDHPTRPDPRHRRSSGSRLAAIASRDRATAAGLGRRVRHPQGLRLLRGAARRPRGRRRLHPAAQRAAPALGRRGGRRRQARPLREAPGARRRRGRRDGRALPVAGVVLMEAFMWRHQPRTVELLPAGRRRRDRRAPADPLVVLVPDRPGRLAARPRPGRRCPLGRRLLRREHRPALRRRRARRRSRAVAHSGPSGVDLSLAATLDSRRRPRPGRLQLRAAVPLPLRARRHDAARSRSPTPTSRPTAPIAVLRDAAGSAPEDARPSTAATSTPRWSTPSPTPSPPAASSRPAEDGLAQMTALDAILAAAAPSADTAPIGPPASPRRSSLEHGSPRGLDVHLARRRIRRRRELGRCVAAGAGGAELGTGATWSARRPLRIRLRGRVGRLGDHAAS